MRTTSGLFFALGAYLWWGLFPLYFTALGAVNSFEIIPWRVLLSLLFCALLLTAMRGWSRLITVLRSPRAVGWLTLSALLLYANWQIFVYGVTSGNVLETSLGYFINPLFTILLGVFVRGESLRIGQWIAVGIGGIAVLVLTVGYGKPPWIAIGIALSFGLYGLVKKQASSEIDEVSGLAVETLMVLPLAMAQLTIVGILHGGLTAFSHGTTTSALLLVSGIVTAVPLLLFAAASRRLPLSQIGFIQFLTPILAFLYGYFVLHEVMSQERWIGFALVWIAMVIFVIDLMRQARTGGVPEERA